ncbi:hypothetical protein J2752_002765 [Halarchaeum rubridurum]|uniref:Uncharacterized protein n=1 Tax=Halarchaeum rubridurum TaxID=489911 RepID=A0A830G5H9_9EURY|nr:hypothetical protein [Halarchaeum rubridurum]GGM75674.1 hypothetical protein GCM10009017_27010 [Halarchaeum rubridurum]
MDQDGEPTNDDRVAQLYRHSDGYPESVLRNLAQLKELLDATRAERGPGYAAASFVFLNKLSTINLYLDGDPDRTTDAAQPADLLDPSNMEHLDQPLFLLGHGIENPADGIHGDEEYLDVVELPTRDPFDESAEWTVKVSSHSAFLRWDGPTDEAFERASWQFNGPLEHTLEGIVAEPA